MLGLDDRQHGPARSQADHFADDVGLVALGGDFERCTELRERGGDDGASVRSSGEQHPWPPGRRLVEVAVRGAVHGELFGEHRLGVDAGDRIRRLDAHDEVEFARDEQIEQRRRRCDAQPEVDVGMLVPKGANDLGVMADRSCVDHAEAQASGGAAVDPAGPVGEIAGESEDLASVADSRLCARAYPPATSVALEQRDAESSLEFGQAL